MTTGGRGQAKPDHYDRWQGIDNPNVSRENIDKSRTHLNYTLGVYEKDGKRFIGKVRGSASWATVKGRIDAVNARAKAEGKRATRKDAVVMADMVSEMKDVLEKVEELRNGAADAQHQANQMALMGVANAQQKAGEMTIKNVEEVTARSRKVIDSMVEESKRRIERLSMVTLPDRLFYYCKWMAVILVLIILVHVLWGMLV